MQFIELPSDIHNLIRNLVPMLLWTSKQFGGRLLNAGDKMDLLLEMGYSVSLRENAIIWNLYGKIVYSDRLGCRVWYDKNHRIHRTKGPAVITPGVMKRWYSFGKLHRLDGPAVEYQNGGMEWWVNGKRHREGAPAVERPDGYEEWYSNGILHRTNGPAIKYPNPNKKEEWWVNGKLHRAEWWVNGKLHRVEGWVNGNHFLEIFPIINFEEISEETL